MRETFSMSAIQTNTDLESSSSLYYNSGITMQEMQA